MPEVSASDYRVLFEVRLLHHYWLDDGAVLFDHLPNAAAREKRLLRYDCRPFLEVQPTSMSEQALGALGLAFVQTGLGFVVAAPVGVKVDLDQAFEFQLSIRDPDYFNYTAQTLRRPSIMEVAGEEYQPPWRCKSGVPILSNTTGGTRVLNGVRTLFLSREIPTQAPEEAVESIVRTAGALQELTSDGPGATSEQLLPDASNSPIFVHQDDVPALTAPPGAVGVPSTGIALSEDLRDDIAMLIRIALTRADDASFNCVDAAGAPLSNPPVFQVRLRNRRSTWTYRSRTTAAVLATEAKPLPLTNYGNAGTRQKPDASTVSAQVVGGVVKKIVSDIYI